MNYMQELMFYISVIVVLFCIGIPLLWYLNRQTCTHSYEIVESITLNDSKGVYLRTIYHQTCTKCNHMRQYIFKDSN